MSHDTIRKKIDRRIGLNVRTTCAGVFVALCVYLDNENVILARGHMSILYRGNSHVFDIFS